MNYSNDEGLTFTPTDTSKLPISPYSHHFLYR